jgi:lipid II:glycine glycyltransferase (peptidoglycan interpeptide bridge formation enzyme)
MHLLQSPAWGTLKSQFGWRADFVPLVGRPEPALMLFRRLPLGQTLAYVPKGPAINWLDAASVGAALLQLRHHAQKQGAIFLRVEPDTPDRDLVRAEFLHRGFRPAKAIQPRHSLVIDLQANEDDILGRMKSKTRYNIRLAGRKGVTVRTGSAKDVAVFHQLSQVTSDRNAFGVHSLAYYQAAFEAFSPPERSLLLAEYENQPLAGVMVFGQDERAYYLYGASNNQHRNLMPTYAVQWAAMQWAKAQGYLAYDLWGIPDAPEAELEAHFKARSDGLWGVYRFKRGFGGRFERSVGAFDFVFKPLRYRLLMQYQSLR